MSVGEITFSGAGGPVTAEIRSGFAQTGAYILTLWDDNQVAVRWEGNFLDAVDDTHELPTPVAVVAGCLLQCRAEIGILPGVAKWALTMTLWQDTVKLAEVSAEGEENEKQLVTVNLWARLLGS